MVTALHMNTSTAGVNLESLNFLQWLGVNAISFAIVMAAEMKKSGGEVEKWQVEELKVFCEWYDLVPWEQDVDEEGMAWSAIAELEKFHKSEEGNTSVWKSG